MDIQEHLLLKDSSHNTILSSKSRDKRIILLTLKNVTKQFFWKVSKSFFAWDFYCRFPLSLFLSQYSQDVLLLTGKSQGKKYIIQLLNKIVHWKLIQNIYFKNLHRKHYDNTYVSSNKTNYFLWSLTSN